jgi:hypothetical protein
VYQPPARRTRHAARYLREPTFPDQLVPIMERLTEATLES